MRPLGPSVFVLLVVVAGLALVCESSSSPTGTTSTLITKDQLKCFTPLTPSENLVDWVNILNQVMPKYGILTSHRVIMFLAQIAYKTESFTSFVEPMSMDCEKYEGGCTYRGRGALKLHHKDAYERAGKALGQDFVKNPTLLELPRWAFEVAALQWQWNDLHLCADNLDLNDCMHRLSSMSSGIKQLITKYEQARQCFDNSESQDVITQKRDVSNVGASCNVPGVGRGTCLNTATRCSGKFYSGYCPGASNIKCCAQTSTSAGTPRPAPTTPRPVPSTAASGSQIICADPEMYKGKLLCHRGTYCGECVSFVKVCTGDNRVTDEWVRGRLVKGANLKRGTAIATFPNGKYKGHAAIYLSQNAQGIQVWDQWKNHPVSTRTIRWEGQGISNNGNSFHVIEGRPRFSAVAASETAYTSPAMSPNEREVFTPLVVGVVVIAVVASVIMVVILVKFFNSEPREVEERV